MELRHAQADDAETISGLLKALGYVLHAAAVRQQLADVAARADDAVFVAVTGDRVVGCISVHGLPLFHRVERFGRITAFVVAEAERGKGVGSCLLAHAHAWLMSIGCSRFELTSGDHRTEARRFYERHGYRRDGQRLVRRATL